MGQEFRITITAADKASEVIDQINAKMDRITEPIERTRKAANLLDKEKGLSNAGRAIWKMGEYAGIADKRVGGLVGSILNIGNKLGVAGGAMGVAGAAAYAANKIGKFGFEVGRTSRMLGISERDLQRYRLAAELTGISQDKMTASIHAFGVTAQNARWGRDPNALYGLNMLNVPIRYTSTGAVDTLKMMKEVFQVLGSKNVPVQTKEMAAGLLGLSEILPVIADGTVQFDKLIESVDKSGAIMSPQGVKAAEEFEKKLLQLELQVKGVGNALKEFMIPGMTAAIELLTIGMDAYGNAAASGFVKGWGFDQPGFYTPEGGFIPDTTQSPQNAGSKSYGIGGKSEPLGIRNNNPGNLRRWGDAPVVNGFARFDTPEAGIAAMTGNLQSYGRKGYNTIGKIINRWAPESDNNNTGAYVAHVSRMTGFAPNQPLDMNDQATMEKLVAAIIQRENGKNPYDKEMISGAVSSRLGGRRDYVTANPPMVQQGAGDAASAPAGGSPGKITVDVNFHNAPPGTQVRNYVEGPVSANTRIGYSNPGTL